MFNAALIAATLVALGLSQAPSAAAPPDRFFDSADVRIRYIEQGSGPPIVLMHGYTGNLDRHFIANGVFASLAKDHRVIALDLRGHGKSGKPHDPSAYGEAMARDVVRLLDHLNIARAHVLGYSLGAIVAGRVATLHPERLISVVYSASLPLLEGATYMDAFAKASVAELESALPFKSLVVAVQAPGTALPPAAELRKMMEPLIATNDVKALAALWRGYKTLAVSDRQLKAITVPSILIVGSKDVSAPRVADLNQRHPQIRTVIVQDAEHGGAAGVMRRDEFMTTLRQFLAAAN